MKAEIGGKNLNKFWPNALAQQWAFAACATAG
jgi:hypothetical protein